MLKKYNSACANLGHASVLLQQYRRNLNTQNMKFTRCGPNLPQPRLLTLRTFTAWIFINACPTSTKIVVQFKLNKENVKVNTFTAAA